MLKKIGRIEKGEKAISLYVLVTISCSMIILTGCSPKLSNPEEIEKFEQAGPISKDSVVVGLGGVRHSGPYRVIPGDILEFQMPAVMRVVSSEFTEWLKPIYGRKDYEPYLVRVNDAGSIILPIVGELVATDKTLSEIEAMVLDAYYPKYVVNPPMVVCEVAKYRRENERVFTVMGLVNKPDAFTYPPDVQYNLMEALAFAGGLNMTADPRYLKIYRQDDSGEIVSATFGIDSKSFVGAYAVLIKPGDVIYIDHTFRTRLNQFLTDAFDLRIGAYSNIQDF